MAKWWSKRTTTAPLNGSNTASPFAFFGQVDFTSAMAHVFFASTWMLTVPQWLGVWPSVGCMVVGAAIKEFVVDPQDWFEGDSMLDGLGDFAGYMSGIVLGAILIWLKGLT
jgi:hypothetical protein